MIGRLLARAAPPKRQNNIGPAGALDGIPGWQNNTYGTWWPDDAYPWRYVTEEEAEGLAVVSGFMGILTSLVEQMPLVASKGVGLPDEEWPVLRNPVPGGNRVLSDFVTEYVRDMALHGNYLAVLGDPAWHGWPDVLYPVPWGQWSIQTGSDGWSYWYDIGGVQYAPTEVFHARRNCRTGQLMGRGFMELNRRLIATCVAAECFAAQYFDGGAVPPAQVTHPNPDLTQDQANDLKAKWRAAVRTREAVVTPIGTTVTPLTSDADKAQLTDSRRFNAQQLAMAVGIPGALLGLDSPSLTYRNITDVFSQFVTTTVMGYLAPLEQQLTLQCLPRGTTARFATSTILRPDLAQRVSIAVQGLTGGVFTADEARALLDLGPLPPVTAGGLPPDQLALMIQKIYLGVGKVLTAEEARTILNSAGAQLDDATPAELEAMTGA
jgi:HK97 family phage portal protein